MTDIAANALVAAPLFVVGISLAISCALKPARDRRRGIRRLEAYVNHPANRIRKEDRP